MPGRRVGKLSGEPVPVPGVVVTAVSLAANVVMHICQFGVWPFGSRLLVDIPIDHRIVLQLSCR